MSSSKKSAASVPAVDEEFNIVKPSGFALNGTLTRREDQSRCGPVVIFLHGTMSSANHNFVPDLAQRLAKEQGIRTYRFDFRFDRNEFEPGHRYKFSGYEDDVDDLKSVVSALTLDGFQVWGLVGHSRGSNDALIFSSRYLKPENDELAKTLGLDANKFCVIACAPRFAMPRMLTTLFAGEQIAEIESNGVAKWESQRGELTVTKADADVVLTQLDMASVVQMIPPQVPILLLHGTDDELIPVEDAAGYKGVRPSIDVEIIDGARHAFRGKKPLKALLNITVDWLSAKSKEFGLDV